MFVESPGISKDCTRQTGQIHRLNKHWDVWADIYAALVATEPSEAFQTVVHYDSHYGVPKGWHSVKLLGVEHDVKRQNDGEHHKFNDCLSLSPGSYRKQDRAFNALLRIYRHPVIRKHIVGFLRCTLGGWSPGVSIRHNPLSCRCLTTYPRSAKLKNNGERDQLRVRYFHFLQTNAGITFVVVFNGREPLKRRTKDWGAGPPAETKPT